MPNPISLIFYLKQPGKVENEFWKRKVSLVDFPELTSMITVNTTLPGSFQFLKRRIVCII